MKTTWSRPPLLCLVWHAENPFIIGREIFKTVDKQIQQLVASFFFFVFGSLHYAKAARRIFHVVIINRPTEICVLFYILSSSKVHFSSADSAGNVFQQSYWAVLDKKRFVYKPAASFFSPLIHCRRHLLPYILFEYISMPKEQQTSLSSSLISIRCCCIPPAPEKSFLRKTLPDCIYIQRSPH